MNTPRTDDQEAKYRAQWLHDHGAPGDWVVLTTDEVAAIRGELVEAQERNKRLESTCTTLNKKWQDAQNYGKSQLAATRKELEAARAIFPEILKALGNGSGCSADASIEFLRCIPEEVQLTIRRLKSARQHLQSAPHDHDHLEEKS